MLAWLRRAFASERKRWAYAAARDPAGRAPWMPYRGNANEAIASSLEKVAARARDAVRNNPYAARIVDVWVANLIGAGIRTTWERPEARIAWEAWASSRDCDAEGALDWYGLQALVARAMVESGEAFIVMRRGDASDTNPVGLRLLVLESDAIDWTQTGRLRNGNIATNGIETSPDGRVVAYHVRIGDDGGIGRTERVAAEDAIHVYRKRRPGQLRDVSWLAPVLWLLRDLTEYEQALLRKAYVEACFALVVTGEGEETLTTDHLVDAHGRVVEAIEPQQILYGRGDRHVETLSPSGGGSHVGFAKRTLEAIAAGAGLTYDQVSGDLSQANYSSLRAGKIEFRRVLEQVQYAVLIPTLIDRVAREFYRAGEQRALWRGPIGRVMHTPPVPEMIDPMKDTQALIAQVRAGFISPQEAVAMFGYDHSSVLDEIAAANAAADERGVILDTDPRRTARSGSAQDANQNAAIEIAATGAAMETNA